MRDDPRILREIAESEFAITDICPQYRGMAVGATNTFCIFHEGSSYKSAKLYWDEDKEIPVLYCFKEHRNFSSYDYIDLILVKKYGKYNSVKDYLLKNMDEERFIELYTLAEQGIALEDETLLEQKIEYIDNLYNKYDNVTDFINSLYLEKD